MRAIERARGGHRGPQTPGVFSRDGAFALRSTSNVESSKHALAKIGVERHLILLEGRKVSDGELFALAKKEKALAQATISNFKVGAAAVTKSGRVLSAHNLEVSDRLAIGTCAESSIAFQLRKESLESLLITSDSEKCIAPCGACRQTLKETAPSEARVIMTAANGEKVETTVGALLPMPTELATPGALAEYSKAIERATQLHDKAETGGRDIARHGAVIVDGDGILHGGATRKQSGTMSLAVQMAADARFLAGSSGEPKAVVIVGRGGGEHGLPVPTGRERQEIFNLGAKTSVVLVNPETGAAALTSAEALLPFAYQR